MRENETDTFSSKLVTIRDAPTLGASSDESSTSLESARSGSSAFPDACFPSCGVPPLLSCRIAARFDLWVLVAPTNFFQASVGD